MRAHRRDTLPIDYGGTVDANEYCRVEQFLEVFHRAAQHVRFAVGMHAHVVAGRVNPVDGVHVDQVSFGSIANHETLRPHLVLIARGEGFFNRHLTAGQLTDQLQQLVAMLVGQLFDAVASGAVDGIAQSLIVDRLQQVVEGIGLEGPQCKLVVSGDEDDFRHIATGQSSQHIEAVHARHLDIQEHEVGRVFTNGRQRLTSITGIPANLDAIDICEAQFESPSRQFLVVDDQRPKHPVPRMEC